MTASASRRDTTEPMEAGSSKTRRRACSRARVLTRLRADRTRLEWLLTAPRYATAHFLSGLTLGYLSTRDAIDEAMMSDARGRHGRR
jgi:hypothetical protein